jgi:Leucine-rich repeat (LRR) protein
VKNWKHLKKLNLRGTKITDSTLEFLAGVPTLEWLDIGWAQITDTGLEHLAGLTNLKWLTMGGNKLTDSSLQFLRQMPQLEYLDIGGQQRTDSGLWSLLLSETGMESIGSVTELRELRMEGRAVTSRGLEMLKPLKKLERLDLQGCKRLREDAVPLLASMKQLRLLDLKDSSLTEPAVTKIRAALPDCKVLF